MRVSPDSKITVATSETTSMAHFIDNTTFELLANVLVDTRPREATFAPDGKTVWVSAEVGGTVAVIDAKSYEVVKKIGFQIPGVPADLIQPMGIDFSKDGKLVFVALGPANRIAVINAETFDVEEYILVGQRPWHMELDPDGSKLYVANGLTNDMTVIDVATLKAEKSVPVGRLPWGVAIKP
jgi:PQQ-dependent catabolism-associated beta-propeller protein